MAAVGTVADDSDEDLQESELEEDGGREARRLSLERNLELE